MKIAIDIRMTGSGGIGSYISALLPYFIKEHECLLFGTKEALKPYESEKNCKTIECSIKCFSIKELCLFPRKLLNAINKCDLYYSPYCNVPAGIKIPVFTTIHDVVFLDIPGLAGKAGTFIRKLFYKRACRKSKVIFTVSDFSSKRIKFHLKPKAKVVCTYNALPDWFLSDSLTSANEKAYSEKKDQILFVGNIKKHKGLTTLLDAFIDAKKEGLSSNLLIIGNKDNFRTKDSSIFNKIEEAPKGTVLFSGKMSQGELKKAYQTSKVLVQPSLYEGFGMPPLEALNLGTHVILSDIEVFKEIYKDFPVTFFECENSEDLKNKLLNLEEICSQKIDIPDVYSFSKTYSIIYKTMEEEI